MEHMEAVEYFRDHRRDTFGAWATGRSVQQTLTTQQQQQTVEQVEVPGDPAEQYEINGFAD